MEKKILSGFMSAIVMGSGQILNKKYPKGVVFFITQLLLILNINRIITSLTGLITLGDTTQKMDGFNVIQGDHSIFLLTEGVLTLFLVIIFTVIYISNIFDAIKNSDNTLNSHNRFGSQYLMLLPGGIGIVFFILLPVVITALIAFTNYSAPDHIPPRNLVDWVGFESFKQIFKLKIYQNTIIKLTYWNIIWAVCSTLTTFAMGLLLALITTNPKIKLKALWRGILILPMAVPAFVSLLIFRLMFNGLGPVNSLLVEMGFNKIPFLTSTWHARILVIVINIWISTPFFMLMISGVLSNIDRSMYEASDIDGASKKLQFLAITMPHILYQTIPVIIMQFAFSFNNFGAVYLVTEGRPVNSSLRFAGDTDILVSWLYKLTLNQNQYNIAAVVSIIIFFVISLLSIFTFTKSSSFSNEGGL